MQLLSVNVGRPRLVQHQGEVVSTAIFKKPVAGPVAVAELGVEGDDQADQRVHGGVDKAVYAYSDDDYAWWRQQFEARDFQPGEFGENLTTSQLASDEVRIGDRYRIGSVLLEATQPRQPCLKLGIKMRDSRFIKWFHQAERPGTYFRVVETGTLQAGDAIELVDRVDRSMSVVDMYRLRFDSAAKRDELQAAAELPRLSNSWRDDFRRLAASRSRG